MEENLKIAIVPWKTPAEFKKVYEYAYSDDLAKNSWAVEQMAVWETRCWPSLPTAVDVTLLFVRSKIQDQLYEASRSVCHAQEVEMMYSSSVVRFVNLLVENDQNSRTKKRIAHLAAERNIPHWIVDIRHSSTHGFNPTLPLLRMAYETIMAYLEDTFWRPESLRVCSIKKSIDETPMIELVQEYRLKQYQVVEENDTDKKTRLARDKILSRISQFLSKTEFRRKFLDVLVRDFVVENDVLTMVPDDEMLKGNEYLSACTLPSPLQIFYDPILLLLHNHNLVSTFLELLLLSQENRKLKILQKIADLVVIHVLNLAAAEKMGVSHISVALFARKGANLNMYRLLYSCVRGCSSSARLVFERLVKDMQLKKWKEELGEMLNIKQGNLLSGNEPRRIRNQRQKRKFDITFTAEDVEAEIHEEMKKRIVRPKENPWSLAPLSIDWASIPIGHVFNPVDITLKDESKQETEANSVDSNEIMYVNALEESSPVEKPRPKNFIFSENPDFKSMIYERKKEKKVKGERKKSEW